MRLGCSDAELMFLAPEKMDRNEVGHKNWDYSLRTRPRGGSCEDSGSIYVGEFLIRLRCL
jgi:hypothetical protein